MQLDGGLMLIFWLLAIVVIALWTFLPFAIFGFQPKMDKMLAELQRGNDMLFEVRAYLKRLSEEATGQPHSPATVVCAFCHKPHSNDLPVCPFCKFRRPG